MDMLSEHVPQELLNVSLIMGCHELRQGCKRWTILKTIMGLGPLFRHCDSTGTLVSCKNTQAPPGPCLNQTSPYLSSEPPRPWPVPVTLMIDFNRLSSVDVNEGTVTVKITVISFWKDPRLAVKLPPYYDEEDFNLSEHHHDPEKKIPESFEEGYYKLFPIPKDIAKLVWNPEVQLYNKRTEDEVYVGWLMGWPPNKFRSWRESLVTVWCDTKNLDDFPFDNYECIFNFTNQDGNGREKVNLTTFNLEVTEFGIEEYDFNCSQAKSLRLWKNYYVSIQLDLNKNSPFNL